ncbi:hypothetical protein A3H80_03045 [Candidatus Roizmanbacteria bacterium RIFCSPLOWO2_02_FULL_37_19]|uniref:Uncharacterized protein n=1 Tax=Candidatus Roizmanbacteria bacterium RIFCSPHIGHO2_02_FULL_37_24 TaxID=1802037 RepID=A0A1F7GYL4_9BACT|nr:MAG: hypothetical protein A2862_00250 [Candidatus Roizmanbacteria bacterium RIFCSPHIGHO2_01_FULL_38_41]OGK24021.1 MAG: hypothetical protein A3C24_02945 [Candidatus Roizmanbacteria bacterium RIFCSPHIGHO2_02_FULL_37_24]OGK32365.1 MAG: hypothetical protein A3E10_04245 [Candidatus Roizmanbacteria bacterium RIFCSPHIGHO2_12_FULL_37_23]OGK44687.1 MAG: hypothetical protein A2956_00975 [Candidatus Roizmanbacteria bacterium RIFCSPLOWO2_01_FULL_37_57]OGK53745.1 MAG: hypothetical protein A3H80_03045 [Ca
MSSLEIGRFINPTIKEEELPTGEALYQRLDSGLLSRTEIGAIVRNRYKETARLLDARLACAEGDNDRTKSLIALIGAFNYIRGMSVLRHDGSVDRHIAPRIMLSPSATVQVLDVARINQDDRVLELFTGGGYASFFLALTGAQAVDSVDLFTSSLYDLDETFKQAYDWVYGDLPEILRPHVTQPHFIQADCAELPDFADPRFQDHYDKVFIHPPYGKETNRLIDITEEEAFRLWISSLVSVYSRNVSPFVTYSVVPSEWTSSLEDAEFPREIFDKSEFLRLRETRMFDLTLCITRG